MALGPDGVESYEPALARGFAARTDGLRRDDFETFGSVTVHLTDDVKGWVDARRPFLDEYFDRGGVAECRAGGECIASMELRRIACSKRGGNAALCVRGGAVEE